MSAESGAAGSSTIHRRRRSANGSLSALGIVVAFLVGIMPLQAHAVDCTEKTDFVRRPNVNSGLGMATTTYIRNSPLDATCATSSDVKLRSEKHGSAHVRNGNDWVELVWLKWIPDRLKPATYLYQVYWEIGTGGVIHQGTGSTGVVTVKADHWARFKIQVVSGTKKWKFYYDDNLDGTFQQIYNNSGGELAAFGGGIPMAETGLRGPGTSGYDHHTNLWYQASTGTWYQWTSQAVYGSLTIPGYCWNQVTGSEYKIQTGTPNSSGAC